MPIPEVLPLPQFLSLNSSGERVGWLVPMTLQGQLCHPDIEFSYINSFLIENYSHSPPCRAYTDDKLQKEQKRNIDFF